jgi:hypothetical protein
VINYPFPCPCGAERVEIHHEGHAADQCVLIVFIPPRSTPGGVELPPAVALRWRCPRCHQMRLRQLTGKHIPAAQHYARHHIFPWVPAEYTAGGELPPAGALDMPTVTRPAIKDFVEALHTVKLEDVWAELQPQPVHPEDRFNQEGQG